MNNNNTPVTYGVDAPKFQIGMMVGRVDNSGVALTKDDADDALAKREMYAIGHVVGYTLNPQNEVLINVQWANQHANYTRSVHPCHLVIIK